MSMRNFWIEGQIDGRKTEITGGPSGADGGFALTVYQRDAGESKVGARLTGRVVDGELILDVDPGAFVRVRVENSGSFRVTTDR
jgi:hypothetical protein